MSYIIKNFWKLLKIFVLILAKVQHSALTNWSDWAEVKSRLGYYPTVFAKGLQRHIDLFNAYNQRANWRLIRGNNRNHLQPFSCKTLNAHITPKPTVTKFCRKNLIFSTTIFWLYKDMLSFQFIGSPILKNRWMEIQTFHNSTS